MVLRTNNPWETSDQAGLVSIGPHSLHVSTSGIPRRPSEPVIIFFSGGGAPCAFYCRLQKLLGEEHRVYFYDRAGYYPSDRGCSKTLTAQDAASELSVLLCQIAVGPPYVLVGHSYGGIVARAFLDLVPHGAVTGMVLADAATELMFQVFSKLPPPSLDAIAEGVDYVALTNLRLESRMTDEEWGNALHAIAETQSAMPAQDARGSALTLAHRQQFQRHALDPWPLVVMRYNMAKDFRILYEAGIARGQGTEAERADALASIERMELFDDELRAGQLRLSNCNRYVQHPERGHDDILRHPETVVEEVRWVMQRQKLLFHEH